MKTLRYFSSIMAMWLIAVLAPSCSDSNEFNNTANKVTYTATMTLSGGVHGFDDSRADSEGWSEGDRLYLNFTTSSGVVEGTAIYHKAVDVWNVTYSGTLTESAVTQCEVYFFDGAEKADDNGAKFNNNTIVYADAKAFYVCKEGAISLTAMLVPQTARFRFKGTPGTTFKASGYDCYTGYSSQSLQQSTANVRTTIADDGYSPYIYGFVGEESKTLLVENGEYEYHRTVDSSTFALGKTGRFTLPNETAYSGWEKKEGKCKVFTVNGVSFKMIRVDAGTFTMGATEEQTSWGSVNGSEKPAHQVTLTNEYYLGETEVTQALWYAVMGEKPTSSLRWSDTNGLGDDYPAYLISWDDCYKFITKLNQLTGLSFRLPTEAEWEYAARGGNKATTQTLFSGSNIIDDVAWYGDHTAHPVAVKAANALGLYDMSGNVCEWCYDWYGTYSSKAQTDPIGPMIGQFHVSRGGGNGNGKFHCRVSWRNDTGIDAGSEIGMRLAIGNPLPEPDPNDKIVTVNGVTFKMKLVEAGTFTMGATEEQTGAEWNESPAHQVSITKDYYMGETEVTQALWYAVMGQKPTSDGNQWSSTYGLGDNYPAYYISCYDCQEFITKLNQLTGLTFRLPTEAEWEYAARGSNKATTQTLYSGSNTIGDVAWYQDNSSSTHIVAGKAANALGLYDMSGNVEEWCSDYFDSYISVPQTDPTGPLEGEDRLLRGGSWYNLATDCRVGRRGKYRQAWRYYTCGMRLVLCDPITEPEPEPEPLEISANGVTFKMKLVEAGTFNMGRTLEQLSVQNDVYPHQVTLTKDYYIGETEVTQALWYAVMGQKPTTDGEQWTEQYGLGDNYPAYYISWNDCQEFITKLNRLTGLTFRLPTEAEWEYAARDGHKKPTQTRYSGSNSIGDVAWYNDNSSSSTHAVAGKAANALGLYDMSGNVREWCNDWYDSSYYSSSPQTDPTGPESGYGRVLRGGSWYEYYYYCCVSYRGCDSWRWDICGMRLALTAE